MGKQKPVEETRMGHIKAAIWRNEDEDGKPFFSVTFTRLYKRAGEWAYSESFGRDDLRRCRENDFRRTACETSVDAHLPHRSSE